MFGAIAIFSVFLAAGAALDRVVTDEGKRQLFARTPLLSDDGTGRVGGVTDQLFRMFLARKLSQASFLAVACLSLILFGSFLVLWWLRTGGDVFGTAFEGIERIETKAAFIVVVCAALIVTDLSSFVGTRILLGLLKHCKNAFEVAVVLFCQFLFSMAIFAAIFALGVVAAVWVANTEMIWSGDLYINVEAAEIDNEANTDIPQELVDLQATATHRYLLVVQTPGYKDLAQADSYLLSNIPLSRAQALDLLEFSSNRLVSFVGVKESEGVLPPAKDTIFEMESPYVGRGTFILHPTLDLWSLEQYYSSAFSLADSVQDGFPASLMGGAGWVRLWHLNLEAQSAIHSSMSALKEYPAYCLDQAIEKIENGGDIARCSNWIMFEKDLRKAFAYNVFFWSSDERGYLPIYAAFVSSLVLTIVFYALFGASLVLRVSEAGYAGRGPLFTWLKTDDHPFTVAFVVVGTVIAMIYLVVSSVLGA